MFFQLCRTQFWHNFVVSQIIRAFLLPMKVSVKAFGPEFQKGGKDFAVTGVPFQDLDSTLVEKNKSLLFAPFNFSMIGSRIVFHIVYEAG